MDDEHPETSLLSAAGYASSSSSSISIPGNTTAAGTFYDDTLDGLQRDLHLRPHANTWSLLLSALFYKQDKFDLNWSNFMLALVLVMLMLTTTIGNLFVIVAILIERNLRTIGNYLVLSLAIADLLVACLVMPLAGIYQILERWTLGVLLCDIWTSADVFCCTGK